MSRQIVNDERLIRLKDEPIVPYFCWNMCKFRFVPLNWIWMIAADCEDVFAPEFGDRSVIRCDKLKDAIVLIFWWRFCFRIEFDKFLVVPVISLLSDDFVWKHCHLPVLKK